MWAGVGLRLSGKARRAPNTAGMVRRWVWGLVAAFAVTACSAAGVAIASPDQKPATEFVHCADGHTCLAPAATLER